MLLAPFFRGLARHLSLACVALTATTAAVFAQTNTPSAADGFDPNVDGNVLAIAKQGNGNLFVAGQFTAFYPNGGPKVARNNLARLFPDGTVDNNFSANIDGAVRAVAVQSNGQIVIGGDFTHIDGNAVGYLARLNQDGSLDKTFGAGVGTSIEASVPQLTPQVLSIVIDAAGRVVVGGNFWSANSTGKSAVICHNLARFSTVGVLDAAFPSADGPVLALASYSNGSVLVGGGFTHLQAAGSTTALARGRIALVSKDGVIDPNFDPEADNAVMSLAIQPDAKILVGGAFANLQPNGSSTASARTHLARLNTDGTLDANFYPAVGGNVYTIGLAADGGLIVGGHFSQVWGVGSTSISSPYVVRFNPDGSIDQSFNPGLNYDVAAVVFQSDDKIVLGGYFTRAQPDGLSSAIVRNRMARVLPSGALDTAFQLDQGGRILASVVQADGRIVVAGTFTSIGGATHNHVARLNANGIVDSSYAPDVNGNVYTLAYDSVLDDVVIGGVFTTVNGFTRNHIARLSGAGGQDDNFDPNIDGQVGVIKIQPDRNILVGGSFTTAQPQNQTAAISRSNLLRLTNAGQIDTAFNPTPNSSVDAIALQSDGKIIIGGSFSALQPGASGTVYGSSGLARLNSDGSFDTGYSPNPTGGTVTAIAIQPADGKAIVGGWFTGFVPPGATSVTERNYLARINTDGSIDATFDPHPNSFVFSLGLQSNGQILVGGAFTSFQTNSTGAWTLIDYFARLNTNGSVDGTLNLHLDEQTGNRIDSINVVSGDAFYIGGAFQSLQPNSSTTRVPRNHFAKLLKDGSVDTTFDVLAGGAPLVQINSIAQQPDAKVIVGGSFSDLGGAKSTNIARFNPEGTADTSFNAALSTDGPVNVIAVRANATVAKTQLGGFGWFSSNGGLVTSFAPVLNTQGQVNAILIQPDNKVVLAGSFSDLSDLTTGNLVRFSPNGTVDIFTSLNGGVTGMVRQNDGKLVIVGDFTIVNGTTRNYIARLGPDGTLDATFDPNASGAISAIAIQSDQKIIIGGSFTSLTPNGASTATTRNYLARLNADGTVDTAYNPNPNQYVNTVAIATVSGKEDVVAGGGFTAVQANSASTSTTRNYIARFNNDGTLDSTFDPNANGVVSTVVIQPSDQKILMGGSFTTLTPNGGSSATFYYIARVNPDGTADTAFYPNPNAPVGSLAVAKDGSIVVGGLFTQFTTSTGTAVARNHLARLTSAGALDQTFNPDVAGTVSTVYAAQDSSGSVLVGGAFSSLAPNGVVMIGGKFATVGGLSLSNLAQLNGDGSVNGAFTPNPDQQVNAIVSLPSTQGFVVGGAFTKIATAGGTVTRNGIARFNNDGSLNSTFVPTVSGTVSALALQSDGKLLVGANTLVRLNNDASGSTDASFNAGAPFVQPAAIALQPDGRIVVAGPATALGATRIIRLNADGTVDGTFSTVSFNLPDYVKTLTLQSDGGIIVVGSFGSIGGKSIANLARLNADGSVDSTFNASPNGPVTALALQSDGRLMIGGTFTTVGGSPRVGLARISNTAPALQSLMVSTDGKTLTWARSGTVGVLEAVTFDVSTDGQNWTELGAGARIAGTPNWQITNLSLSTTTTIYVRARGITPTSSGTSTGIYQTVRQINVASGVTGATSETVAIAGLSGSNSHYAWVYDPVTGVYQTVDLSSGLVVNLSKVLGYNPTTGAMVATASSRLVNLSTRADVTAAQPLIGGFAIEGSAARTVLIRAVGPSLQLFSVTNYLKKPELIVYDRNSSVIASNHGWNNDAALTAAAVKTGAFPLIAGSSDAAMLLTLAPGTYSVQVADAGDGSGGNALVEIYDAGDLSDTSARIVNLSGRAVVSSQGTVIGGLVINGSAPKTLLIRGVGPSMAKLSISNALADPKIAIYDTNDQVLATNDNWNVSTDPTIPNLDLSTAVINAATSVGAFQLDQGSKDAAMIVTLSPGVYTVQLTAVAGSGTGMIEVYELP